MFGIIFLLLGTFCIHFVGGQFEGTTCTIERTRSTGICRTVNNCPAVIEDIRNRRSHTRCGFAGRIEIVCCPPPPTPPPVTTPQPPVSSLRISQQKCVEYSSAVFDYVSVLSLQFGAESVKRPVDKCGHKVIPLIVGGEFAKAREFPHMALVGFDAGEGIINWECGGTLISDQYVLTAGHCIRTRLYGDAKYVRLGELDKNIETDDARPEDFEIAQIIAHPQYRTASKYNDIALLRLARKVTLNPYKRPACLPTQFEGPERNVIATGWGQTDWSGPSSSHLQKVTLEKFGHAECNASYVYEIDRRLANGIVDETQICAGSRDESKDTCQGDSGGPIQVFHPTQYCMYTVVGITSFGITCGNIGIPGIYTRVFAYVDWIENIVWGNGQ